MGRLTPLLSVETKSSACAAVIEDTGLETRMTTDEREAFICFSIDRLDSCSYKIEWQGFITDCI